MSNKVINQAKSIIEQATLEREAIEKEQRSYPASTLRTENVYAEIVDFDISTNKYGYPVVSGTIKYGISEKKAREWHFTEKASYPVVSTLLAHFVAHNDMNEDEAKPLTTTTQGVEFLIAQFNKGCNEPWLTATYRFREGSEVILCSWLNLIVPERKEDTEM